MTTIKLAVVPAKALKSGKHKIRIAIGHKQETRYIVTRFVVDSPDQLRDGQIVGRPDASRINIKLRNLLNSYEDALDRINTNSYTCTQVAEYLSNIKEGSTTFSSAADDYIRDMLKEGRKSTAALYQRTCDYTHRHHAGWNHATNHQRLRPVPARQRVEPGNKRNTPGAYQGHHQPSHTG